MNFGELTVDIAETDDELGRRVAAAFARAAQEALAEREKIAVILAAANSQRSFARALADHPEIEWDRITVLHMDEYVGLSADHPASFRRWMRDNIVGPYSAGGFDGVAGDHEPIEEEIARYTAVVREWKPSITVMGIGENGHLAFNDPPAVFETDEVIHLVELDDVSRRQQVGEGHFPTFDDTPSTALSLTIPALLASDTVLVAVPERRKAEAVVRALTGEITPDCPASILRTVPHATLFLDADSASLLGERA